MPATITTITEMSSMMTTPRALVLRTESPFSTTLRGALRTIRSDAKSPGLSSELRPHSAGRACLVLRHHLYAALGNAEHERGARCWGSSPDALSRAVLLAVASRCTLCRARLNLDDGLSSQLADCASAPRRRDQLRRHRALAGPGRRRRTFPSHSAISRSRSRGSVLVQRPLLVDSRTSGLGRYPAAVVTPDPTRFPTCSSSSTPRPPRHCLAALYLVIGCGSRSSRISDDHLRHHTRVRLSSEWSCTRRGQLHVPTTSSGNWTLLRSWTVPWYIAARRRRPRSPRHTRSPVLVVPGHG